MGFFNKKNNDEDVNFYQVDDGNFEDGTSVDWDEVYNDKKNGKKNNKNKNKKNNRNNESEEDDWDTTYNYAQDNRVYQGQSFNQTPNKDTGNFSMNKKTKQKVTTQNYIQSNTPPEKEGRNKSHMIIISIIVFYLVYIGGGFIITYSNGIKTAQVINVDLIERRESYKIAKADYEQLSLAAISIESIDKKVAVANNQQMYTYSVEYNKMGTAIDNGIRAIKGTSYGDNAPIQALGAKIYDELGQYITLMTKALANGDQDSYANGMAIRSQAYSDYSQYSQFIKQLAVDAQIKQ